MVGHLFSNVIYPAYMYMCFIISLRLFSSKTDEGLGTRLSYCKQCEEQGFHTVSNARDKAFIP